MKIKKYHTKKLGRVGIIGRFKPLHTGGAHVLKKLCEQANEVIIGIGSSNKYDIRNPFTITETKEMIHAYLQPKFNNYRIIEIPDFGHLPKHKDGQTWKNYMIEQFGVLDHFISGNEYVKKLLENNYEIIDSYKIIAKENQIFISGSLVRQAMIQNNSWEKKVPKEIALYIKKHELVARLKKEFGLKIIQEMKQYNLSTARQKKEEQEKVWKK